MDFHIFAKTVFSLVVGLKHQNIRLPLPFIRSWNWISKCRGKVMASCFLFLSDARLRVNVAKARESERASECVYVGGSTCIAIPGSSSLAFMSL